MREIRFRARSVSIPISCWIYGYFMIRCDTCFILNKDGEFRVRAGTEGQFTGLKDKNGKEIYEGDIVDCKMSVDHSSLPHTGEIVYNETFGAFATKNLAGETLLHNHLLSTFKIIGNIHENLGLLKDKE